MQEPIEKPYLFTLPGPLAEADTPMLAKVFGISASRIHDFAADETLPKGSRRGRFPFLASVQAYISRLRLEAAKQGGQGLAEARARLAKEQADAHALKNAISRGEMIPAIEAEREWASQARLFRHAILAWPERIRALLPHMSRADIAALDRFFRDELTEIGTNGPGEGNGTAGMAGVDSAAAAEVVGVD